MKFVYQPEGADPRSWDFEPDKLMNVEAEMIEKVTKMTFAEWSVAVARGSMTALHALLWVMLKREVPTLTYAAVEFSLSDVTFDMTDEETQAALTELERRVAAGEDLEPEELAALEELRRDAAPTPDADDTADDGEGEGPKAIALGAHLAR